MDAVTVPPAPGPAAGPGGARPRYHGADAAGDLLAGLDAEQRHAVTVEAAPLAVVAAAGSGKTTVLTRRIAHRILSGTATPRHVLALTFTREAADEMRRRLRRLDVRETVECGTFHAVALRLLTDRAIGTGTAPPSIARDRLRLVREAALDAKLRCDPVAAMADIDWARARLVPPERFREAAQAARRRTPLRSGSFAALVAAYETLKRRRGVVDFDDLLVGLVDAARRDPVYADILRWRFRHLFVDEAQDLNPLQHLVLETIRGGRADLCLVGDPRQSIYGWNGADPTMFASVEQRYPGITVAALTSNHRCSPQVVAAGAAVLRAGGQHDDTVSVRTDGPPVRIVTCADEAEESAKVAAAVADLSVRHGAGAVAVLARTNDQLTSIHRSLSRRGIPTVRAVGRSPLERALAEATRMSRDQLAVWALEAADDDDEIRRRVASAADRYLASEAAGGFAAWVEVHQPFADLDASPAAAVALHTFHTAKGREWKAVVAIGIEDGLLPHASAVTAEQRQEEARLAYVAFTRAESELILVHSRTRAGKPVRPSPWLDDVAATIGHEPRPATVPPRVRRPKNADPLAGLRQWRAGVARVAGVAPAIVCSDAVLRRMLTEPPRDLESVARLLGIDEEAAERLAPGLGRALGTPLR